MFYQHCEKKQELNVLKKSREIKVISIIKTLLLCINDKLKIKPLRKIIAKNIQLNYIKLSALLIIRNIEDNYMTTMIKDLYKNKHLPIEPKNNKDVKYLEDLTINEFAFACAVLEIEFDITTLPELEYKVHETLKIMRDYGRNYVTLFTINKIMERCPELADYFVKKSVAKSVTDCDNSAILLKFLEIGFKNGYDFTNYLKYATSNVLTKLL